MSEHSVNVPFKERITCTIPEACRATGLGRSKLYEMMDAGLIEHVKIGKRRLVVVRSLMAAFDPNAPKVPAE